jgi:putative transposase
LNIGLVREDGQIARPWLTIVIDDYSRAIAGYYLGFDPPSSTRTALALRQAIWRKGHSHWHVCGIPEVLYTDNGSDFTSKHIEQVAVDLKIRLVFSTPGKPQGRGRIERFFRTVNEMQRAPRGDGAAIPSVYSAKLLDSWDSCENHLLAPLLRRSH